MSSPFSRAAFNSASVGPVSSPTQASADLHQWWSHMSQTTIAVFFASHSAIVLFRTPSSSHSSVWSGSISRVCRRLGRRREGGRVLRVVRDRDVARVLGRREGAEAALVGAVAVAR